VSELREMLEGWFVKYVDPDKDGIREPVTGRGQIGMAGTRGNGRTAFLEDWKYLRDEGERDRTSYSPYDESPVSD
jgi:hypothetical protein